MKEFKLYTISEEEIIDAFKKAGVEVDYVYGYMGCVSPQLKNEDDWDELYEKYEYPTGQIITKYAFGLGDDMGGYLFCPDGDQSLPGDFCFIPIPLSECHW